MPKIPIPIKDDEEDCTGIICKVWSQCHTPELCQEKCWDEDIAWMESDAFIETAVRLIEEEENDEDEPKRPPGS